MGSARSSVVLFDGPGSIELSAGTTHIQLAAAFSRRGGRRAQLVLNSLTARHAPGTAYSVHLNPGDSPPMVLHSASHAGTLNFQAVSTWFDVSALLFRFGDAARDKLIVSVVPDGTVHPTAAPVIGALAVLAV